MITFTLTKNDVSGLYSVLENGIQIYNDIFTGQSDFESELRALGFHFPFTILVADLSAGESR